MEKINLFEDCLQFNIETDTRKIKPGSVFVALKGDNFDGNKFCQNALDKGANFCISDDQLNRNKQKIIVVENSLLFLQELANYRRKKLKIPFIGITGSNGKTTNKELIHAVLSKKYKTSATKGNLNNHLGVPFSILDIPKETEIAIIEMGANKPGDIKELAEIAEPNYGMITNIGSAHLEGFGGLEGVIKTKKELYDFLALEKNNTIIYNSDDSILKGIVPAVNLIPFGSQEKLKANFTKVDPFLSFSYSCGKYTSPTLSTNLIGDYNINNFLAAIQFGILFEVDFELINQAITEYAPDNNRSQLTKTDRNQLIMDCYNANPTSMLAAIENFYNIEFNDKICILGDMLELGEDSDLEHKKIFELVREKEMKTFFVGPIFNSLFKSKNTFESTKELVDQLDLTNLKNQLILLKGSRAIQLENLKDYL